MLEDLELQKPPPQGGASYSNANKIITLNLATSPSLIKINHQLVFSSVY